ncbi:DUF6314 family protein [Streptomyces sp. NPDC093544]|jgi:hypothetical protein|uniref:DUF6314 family protein n=1 Tax=Streptomyces sp. NPDC093544 TaxID=3155200 RepID=UPI0034175B72
MGEFWPVDDVLAYLAGSWRVERTVRDLASGSEGHFTGTAVFGPLESTGFGPLDDTGSRPQEAVGFGPLEDAGLGPLEAAGLLHHESGTFVWQGTPRPAERTLRFLPGQGPSTADVRFSDGRPFHDLDLTSGRYVADHPCSADLYRGEFTVRDEHHWRTVWRVAGPAKDLVLTTDYTRDEACRTRQDTDYRRED